MNIVTQTWEGASKAALSAIREIGDEHLILVPGSNWSQDSGWVDCHGNYGWINDPGQNFAYEAHCYFHRALFTKSYGELAAHDPNLTPA